MHCKRRTQKQLGPYMRVNDVDPKQQKSKNADR